MTATTMIPGDTEFLTCPPADFAFTFSPPSRLSECLSRTLHRHHLAPIRAFESRTHRVNKRGGWKLNPGRGRIRRQTHALGWRKPGVQTDDSGFRRLFREQRQQ